MKTWTLQDLDSLTNPLGRKFDCTAESLMDALRMLNGYGRAAYTELVNNIPGCRTLAVYAKAPARSGADWSRLGTVFVENPDGRE